MNLEACCRLAFNPRYGWQVVASDEVEQGGVVAMVWAPGTWGVLISRKGDLISC